MRTYSASIRRLEAIVNDGLRRGLDPNRLGQGNQRAGDATLAYRAARLAQARAIVAELGRLAGQAAPLIVGRTYRAGIVVTDRHVEGAARVVGRFDAVHMRAVELLAGQMTRSLQEASARVGVNVQSVFDRASVLDGALPPARLGDVPFLGRRIDDPWRRVGLDVIAQGTASGDTRRQISAQLARQLVTEGVTDAMTGYVDRAGRRWPLEHYAAMSARTTTREAMTAAVVNRMDELGDDLITISSHRHLADECTPYDGKTFSLRGRTPGYKQIPELPPFHPWCKHVAGPASSNLDAFEAELDVELNGAR